MDAIHTVVVVELGSAIELLAPHCCFYWGGVVEGVVTFYVGELLMTSSLTVHHTVRDEGGTLRLSNASPKTPHLVFLSISLCVLHSRAISPRGEWETDVRYVGFWGVKEFERKRHCFVAVERRTRHSMGCNVYFESIGWPKIKFLLKKCTPVDL